MTLQEVLQRSYPARIRPDRCSDGTFCYVAEIPSLPGCGAHGDTMREATDALEMARVAYLTHLFEEGAAIPEPEAAPDVRWEAHEVSAVA